MQAVIMAGGEGSRLRPLTCDIPKPMARLCGRPIIEYILELLGQHGVTSAAITIKYLPNLITEHFSSGSYNGINLAFCEEDKPLGTAGSVKNAAGVMNEPFIVISGDALCNFDLTSAVNYQKSTGADVVIITSKVDDPREYGLVTFDSDGRVTGFIEKPGWSQAHTNTANTGIYIIKPEVLALVPENEEFDFAKDLFPLMLQKNMNIRAMNCEGYWCDIGDLKTYLQCNADMLKGKTGHLANVEGNGIFGSPPSGKYRITPPVYIGRGVTISDYAEIGPNTVLDDGVFVGEYAKIRNSVILHCGYIGENARLTGSIVCKGGSVKNKAALYEGSVVGSGAVVGQNCDVCSDVKIWPGKSTGDCTNVKDNLQYGQTGINSFGDEGINGETGVDITPELCVKIGAAAGSLKNMTKVALATDNTRVAKALSLSLASGVLSSGTEVWDFGVISKAQMTFFVSFCGLSLGIYVEGGADTCLKMIGEGGLPLSRSVEREFEQRIARSEFKRANWSSFKEIADMSGMRLIYQQQLYSEAPEGLSGVKVNVKCSDMQNKSIFENTLIKLGAELGEGMTLELSPCGTRLKIFDPACGEVSGDQVFTLCAKSELENGKDVALPFEAPEAIEKIASDMGRKVLRYYNNPATDSDKKARQTATNQTFLYDGIIQGIKLLAYLKKTGKTLAQALSEIPVFSMIIKVVDIEDSPANIMDKLTRHSGAEKGEGITVRLQNGKVSVRPEKRGRQIKLVAEAVNSETAEEMCLQISDILKQ